jgi:hypothetical protein
VEEHWSKLPGAWRTALEEGDFGETVRVLLGDGNSHSMPVKRYKTEYLAVGINPPHVKWLSHITPVSCCCMV